MFKYPIKPNIIETETDIGNVDKIPPIKELKINVIITKIIRREQNKLMS